MRRIALAALTLLGVAISTPASADDYVYLWPDAADRYLPAIDAGGGPSVLANIDSMTPPAVSPDGQRIAFSGSLGDESLGRYAIFIVNSNGSKLIQLTSGNLGEFDPAWSPDGTRLVVSQNMGGGLSPSNCCRVVTVNVSNGQLTPITANVGAVRPSYSAQGSFLLYDTPKGAWKISPAGGKARLLAPSGRDAASSPGEDRIVYVISVGGRNYVNTVSSSGGPPSVLYSTTNQIESPTWISDRIYFFEYSGFGYDGRANVMLRSVLATGGGAVTERRFNTHVVGFGAGLAEPPAFSVGDIDGNGDDDVAKTGPVNRTALLSDGNGFEDETWDGLTPTTGWGIHLGGDFDGNGQDDVASFLNSDGTWHVARAGNGSYATSVWADFSTASGWQARVAGDFDGDGRDDIAQFHPGNGTWWVSRSTGSGFSTRLWADFSTSSGWGPQLAGDFNGDGRHDIANFHSGNGTWWVSRSTGSQFTTGLWLR